MKTFRRYISLFISTMVVLGLLNTPPIYAEAAVTADITVTSRNVVITGRIQNATEENQVTLLVGEPKAEKIIYLNQTTSNASGAFTFNFVLPEDFPAGSYPYRIGTDAGTAVYIGTFTYRGEKQTRKFIDADLDIVLDNYTPKIVGTIECGTGKSVTINITNTTDNTVAANDTLTSANGLCEISYTLPSLVQAKDYTVSVVCSDYEKAVTTMQLSISSSVILVSASGTISTADNVTVNAQFKSVATDLIDKSLTINGTKSVSGTLPNVLSNATYEFNVEGYEEYYPSEELVGCTIIGTADDIVRVIASARNIASFENRTFELNYNSTQLEAVSLLGEYAEDSVGTGRKGNVEILSHSDGKIVFKLVNVDIPDGKVWNGVLNIFKFKLTENYSGNAAVTIR